MVGRKYTLRRSNERGMKMTHTAEGTLVCGDEPMWRREDLRVVSKALAKLGQVGGGDLVGHVVTAGVDANHRCGHQLAVEDERHLCPAHVLPLQGGKGGPMRWRGDEGVEEGGRRARRGPVAREG